MRCRAFLVTVLGLVLCACSSSTVTEDPKPTTPQSVTAITPIVITPRPSPSPTDPPQDPPNGGGGGGGGGADIPGDNGPVGRVDAKVFFLECNGEVVPNSGNAAEASVGCRVHLDATAKNSSGKPTKAVGNPHWTWSNPGIISANSDAEYTPTLTALAPGDLDMDCQVDGVRSNTVHIRLK